MRYIEIMDMMTFMQPFSTDDVCRAFLKRGRWPEGPACPKCGSVGRASRVSSRPGTLSCCVRACKAQFSVTAGTSLHRTRVPPTKGGLAIWLISTSSKGVNGRKLAEWLEVDYRTAWYMGHRIRRLLSDADWRKLSAATRFIQVLGGVDVGPLGYRKLVACG